MSQQHGQQQQTGNRPSKYHPDELCARGNPDQIAQNPRDREPKPPFPQQAQEWPGLESKMRPLPDFGEATYKGYGRLAGKVALITGGDSGIGRTVALAFAREGADIAIAYLCEHSDAEETVRAVKTVGRRALAMAGDLQEESHCQQVVQATVQ